MQLQTLEGLADDSNNIIERSKTKHRNPRAIPELHPIEFGRLESSVLEL